MKKKKKKKRRMRILSARIFLSLLAGKFNKIEQLLTTTNESQKIKIFNRVAKYQFRARVSPSNLIKS